MLPVSFHQKTGLKETTTMVALCIDWFIQLETPAYSLARKQENMQVFKSFTNTELDRIHHGNSWLRYIALGPKRYFHLYNWLNGGSWESNQLISCLFLIVLHNIIRRFCGNNYNQDHLPAKGKFYWAMGIHLKKNKTKLVLTSTFTLVALEA